jgi:hypothetical protein
VSGRGIPLPATTHIGDWTIDTGDDGETTVTGPARLQFSKSGGGRIYHYEIVEWLRRNLDIAASGGTVNLVTWTFRATP